MIRLRRFGTGPRGLQGAQGVRGAELLTGHGVPLDATGNNGDTYFDLDTGNLYGPRSAGAWGPMVGNISGVHNFEVVNGAGANADLTVPGLKTTTLLNRVVWIRRAPSAANQALIAGGSPATNLPCPAIDGADDLTAVWGYPPAGAAPVNLTSQASRTVGEVQISTQDTTGWMLGVFFNDGDHVPALDVLSDISIPGDGVAHCTFDTTRDVLIFVW